MSWFHQTDGESAAIFQTCANAGAQIDGKPGLQRRTPDASVLRAGERAVFAIDERLHSSIRNLHSGRRGHREFGMWVGVYSPMRAFVLYIRR